MPRKQRSAMDRIPQPLFDVYLADSVLINDWMIELASESFGGGFTVAHHSLENVPRSRCAILACTLRSAPSRHIDDNLELVAIYDAGIPVAILDFKMADRGENGSNELYRTLFPDAVWIGDDEGYEHQWQSASGFVRAVVGPAILEAIFTRKTVVQSTQYLRNLVQVASKHPETLCQLTPREFEEFIADLLHLDGYEVELTKQSRDEGRDILAYHKGRFNKIMHVFEVKRYAPERPVGIEYVQRLRGVIAEIPNAGYGHIVTTSRFTGPAIEAATRVRTIFLHDGEFVRRWAESINDAMRPR